MSKMEFAPNYKHILSIFFLIFFAGCAEIGPPPGGEVDKVKPRILSSDPANGSTLVEPGNSITISFSERVEHPESENSIYISPRLISEPKVKWKSDQLTITLPDSFEVDQTYIISFAEGIKDLRNNPLDSGSIIAFTTGESLADGIIKGIVINENYTPQNNIVVGLYKKGLFENEPIIDSLFPTYMGITNSDGTFAFQYIPYGEYIILAIADRNKNDRLDKENEFYGLPTELIYLDSSNNLKNNIELTLTNKYETAQKIESVRQTSDNLFIIDFNYLSHATVESNNYKLCFKDYTDSTLVYNSEFLLLPDTTTNSLTAYFGDIVEGNYKFEFKQTIDDSIIVFDSVKVKKQEDNGIPVIKLFSPDIRNVFKDSLEIIIQFSESIDTSKISTESFFFLGRDSNLIVPNFKFINPSLCRLSNDFLSDDIYKYFLYISEFDIFDLSGNKMGDSTIMKEININNNDSLGIITGKIIRPDELVVDRTIILSFQNLTTHQVYTYISSDNTFNMNLPQGNYYLNGYIDLNSNNKRDFGNISPLLYAEPSVNYGDTLKVRARFETTDILLEFK